MDFVVIDVETANASFASICQIGIVGFEGGQVVHRFKTLVNPREKFDVANVEIHGITPKHVEDAPEIANLIEELRGLLNERIVVSHTSFDRTSMNLVAEKHSIPNWGCRWLDTARVARRVWPQFAERGYGLKPVADFLGITFRHHDAEEDAFAAGQILLSAMKLSGLNAQEWLTRSIEPISGQRGVARAGNPDGPLYGETIAFTGTMNLPRKEAAAMAAHAGCEVADGVNKGTTILVVGDQDLRQLAGQEKSSKHRKAEALMAKGQHIRIVGEGDFRRLVVIEERVERA